MFLGIVLGVSWDSQTRAVPNSSSVNSCELVTRPEASCLVLIVGTKARAVKAVLGQKRGKRSISTVMKLNVTPSNIAFVM